MTAKTKACVRIAATLVCPDMKGPLDEAGSVSNIPGLNAKNRTVGTIRSAGVRTRPNIFDARILYASMKTSAWNITLDLEVSIVHSFFVSGSCNTNPGLRAINKETGIDTFGLDMSIIV